MNSAINKGFQIDLEDLRSYWIFQILELKVFG